MWENEITMTDIQTQKNIIKNSIYRQTLITDLIADYLGFESYRETEDYFDPNSYDIDVDRDEDGVWHSHDTWKVYTPVELIEYYKEVIN